MNRLLPLTSIRFFAAFAVVLFHAYENQGREFARQHPSVAGAIEPVLMRGNLAVDLFFVLSGFVLAWNYLDRLGERFSARATVTYLRARLARVYPLFVVMTLVGGAVIWIEHRAWGTGPRGTLTLTQFIKQVFLVQQWDTPTIIGNSWCQPAWSISCEWAAYLSLPLVILVIWRLRRHTALLFVIAVLAMAPLTYLTWKWGSGQDFPWSWAYRIGCDFVAGTALGAAVLNLKPSPRQRRLAEFGAGAVILFTLVWVYVMPERQRDYLQIAWLPLIVLFAISAGPLTKLLSHRILVLGGEISFALYMVHGPLQDLIRDASRGAGMPAPVAPYLEMAMAVAFIPLAWLMFRFIEEPMRHRLAPRRVRVPALAPADG